MSSEKRKLEEVLSHENTNKFLDSESGFSVPIKHSRIEPNLEIDIKAVKERVKEKKETLRKLELVRMYRSKWEVRNLDSVTMQWLKVCQDALEDLRFVLQDKQESGTELTLISLIQKLGLDPKLLSVDEEEDCFLENMQ